MQVRGILPRLAAPRNLRPAAPFAAAPGAVALVVLLASACSSGSTPKDPFLSGNPALIRTGPTQVLIEGDSLALTLGIGISGAQEVYGLHIIDDGDLGCGVASGDPILIGGTIDSFAPGMPAPEPDTPPKCPDWKKIWADSVATVQPDVVAILVGRWETVNRMHDGRWMNIGQPAYDTYLTSQLSDAVRIAGSRGAEVVLFTMPYLAPQKGSDGSLLPETDPKRVDLFNEIVRKVASENPTWVTVIDLNAMLDPSGSYTAQIGAVTTRNLVDADGNPDGSHISPAGGELVAPKILPKLARLGALARAAA